MKRSILRRCLTAFAGLGSLLLVCGCAPAISSDNPAVKKYVDDALSILETGIYAQGQDWQDAAAHAREDLYASPTIKDTYPGLRRLAEEAGGRHSSFVTPADTKAGEEAYATPGTFSIPTVEVDGDVAVLTLPTFGGTDQAAQSYAEAGSQAIQDASSRASCGWIVDLRHNAGGNAYAMLAAVAPLLSDGRVAGFKSAEGEIDWISLSGGRLPGFDTPAFSTAAPVVVLTSQYTASAAELVAVSFSAQSHSRRLGEKTAGLTSSNVAHKLSDGASLIISTAWYVDRTGKVFSSALVPDEEVLRSPGGQLAIAKDELRRQCSSVPADEARSRRPLPVPPRMRADPVSAGARPRLAWPR